MQDCPNCIHECTHVDSLDRQERNNEAELIPEELGLWRTLQWLRYPSRLAKNARSNQKQSGAMRSSQEQLEPARDSRKTPGDGRQRASSVGRPASGWERLRAARNDQREAGSGRRRLAEPGSELYRTIIEQLVIN